MGTFTGKYYYFGEYQFSEAEGAFISYYPGSYASPEGEYTVSELPGDEDGYLSRRELITTNVDTSSLFDPDIPLEYREGHLDPDDPSFFGAVVMYPQEYQEDQYRAPALYITNKPIDTSEYNAWSLNAFDPVPVCFVHGTLVDTPAGVVAIEFLKPGDKVIGKSGVRTVEWVGWRDYSVFALLDKNRRANLAPVVIRRNAVADGVPSCDLRVSPWHCLYVDGLLVRAIDLVNGVSIVQELHTRAVSYWHIELDQFDVVLAHGMYSESWADGGNRDFFQNVDVTTLRPEDKIRHRAERPGFNVVQSGDARFTAIRERLEARAATILNSLPEAA